jgi:hypothetical protein
MYYFTQYSAVLDALAGYENTLGLIVSNQNIAAGAMTFFQTLLLC